MASKSDKAAFRIISLSHSEDIDGIASQAIITRYFHVLKKPIKPGLITRSDVLEIDQNDVEITFVRSDYSDYIHYWAAIIAQNWSENSELDGIINETDDFASRWRKVYQKIETHQVDGKTPSGFKKFDHIMSSERDTITNLSERLKGADLVILSDLGVNKSFKSLFPYIQDVPFSIAYFDHHEHFEEAQSFFERHCSVYIVDNTKCASQIVKDYFLPDDKIANEIVSYGIDSDFRKWEMELSENLQHIIGKFSRDYAVMEQIRLIFAQGIFFDDYIKNLLAKVQQWLMEQEDYLLDHIFFKKVHIGEQGDVEFMIGGSEMRPGRTIRVMEQQFDKITGHGFPEGTEPPHIIVSINETTGKTNINSHAFPTIKVAQAFGGGGHVHRAGFQIPMKYVDEQNLDNNFFDCLKKEQLMNKIIEIFTAD